jgi:glycine cleavage system aminomethyltransferase T
VVGQVTSGCWSPGLQQPLGLGYIKRGANEPGAPVVLVTAAGKLRATVAALP